MKNFLSIQFVIFCITFGYLEATDDKHCLGDEQNLLIDRKRNLEEEQNSPIHRNKGIKREVENQAQEEQNLLITKVKRIKREEGENQAPTDNFFTQFPRLVLSLIIMPLSMKEKLNCLLLSKSIKTKLEPIVFKSITFPILKSTESLDKLIQVVNKNAKFIEEIDFSISIASLESPPENLSKLWRKLPTELRKLKYTEKITEDKSALTKNYLKKEDFQSIMQGRRISHLEFYLANWSPFVNKECDYDDIKKNKFIQLIPDNSLKFFSFQGLLVEDIRRATIFDIALLSHKFSRERLGTLILSHFCLSQQDILTEETPVAPDNKLAEIIIKELWVEDKNSSFDFFKYFKYLKKLTIEKIFMRDKLTLLFYDLKSFHCREIVPCLESEKPIFFFEIFLKNEDRSLIEMIKHN